MIKFLEHPSKTSSPSLPMSKLLGRVISIKFIQFLKALSPMLVTPLGMFIPVKLPQPQKAQLPMLVTPLGMFIPVKLLQPQKAQTPMLVTLYIVPSFSTYL